ncbi:mechanosensitive ion channel domain-containing protein [uncultured Cetobacterium sp.]|uniref:mechanosensitive ion channel family protein n=1 Tax=uncultured Cetobacterium sp. TaxID=527638 RepID=UPI00262EDB45|nr:mechanosensitive ion channel domain-containing protein [uncultured Cetobacterium sp.]
MNFNQSFNMLKNNRGEPIFESLGHDMIVFLVRLLAFLLIIYIGSYFVKKVDKYIEKIPVVNQDINTKQFTKSITKLGLNLVFFLIGLLAFGFSESSIATMISAIGLGIGISLKEFLSNLAGGVVLFFSRPFSIGNFIKINGVMGEVVKIEVFSTHINSLDGRRVIIPNNVMISGNIINYDTNLFRRIKLMLSVSYDSDMKKVIDILENISKTYDGLDRTRENFINTMEYGDSSINILFMVWTPTKGYYKVRGELMAYILDVFNKENINVPFNILDINLSQNK